jgi:hypothetical protein
MNLGWRICAVLLLTVPLPAHAAGDWSSYLNDRYGYEIAVPPGFVGEGEPDAHDGQVFRSADGNARLTVWGGYLFDGESVEDDVGTRLDGFRQSGWNVTHRSVTPDWASWSGTKGARVSYSREIAGCQSDRFAAFELQYPAGQIKAMNPVVTKLVMSLKQKLCPE